MESSILDFVLVLNASLDINYVNMYFMISKKESYEICKYDLENLIRFTEWKS